MATELGLAEVGNMLRIESRLRGHSNSHELSAPSLDGEWVMECDERF